MKNKKIICFVILILIIQMLIPGYLLADNYLVRAEAMEKEEYKFQVYYIYFHDELIFDADISYYDGKISVSKDDDGFAKTEKYENMNHNCWFKWSAYSKARRVKKGKYTFDITMSKKEIKEALSGGQCYVTAKIYKGLFIPTAIFVNDQRLISFSNDI